MGAVPIPIRPLNCLNFKYLAKRLVWKWHLHTSVTSSLSSPPPQCSRTQDYTAKLLSAIVTQDQGPSPIFSATGYTFTKIVVDQTTGLDNIMYEVMFIAAVNGSK